MHGTSGIGIEYSLDFLMDGKTFTAKFLGVEGLGKRYPGYQLRLDPEIKYKFKITRNRSQISKL